MRRLIVPGWTAAAALVSLASLAQQGPLFLTAPTVQAPSRSSSPDARFSASTPAPLGEHGRGWDQSMTGESPRPSFSVFGMPVSANAPVAAPYSNSSYSDFAGQPQFSGDSLLNWRRDR